LPGIKGEEVGKLTPHARDLEDFVHAFQEKVDGRIGEVKKAVESWGRIELVDAVFKGMS
jgi:translocation protein SEC63